LVRAIEAPTAYKGPNRKAKAALDEPIASEANELAHELNREIDVLLVLNGQVQTRGQVLTAAAALLLSVVAASISAGNNLEARLEASDATGLAILACVLLAISVSAGVATAWPFNLPLQPAEFYKEAFEDDRSYDVADQGDVVSDLMEPFKAINLIRVSQYAALEKAGRVRGVCLFIGLMALALSALTATATVVQILS
jgi:hypothetical protein